MTTAFTPRILRRARRSVRRRLRRGWEVLIRPSGRNTEQVWARVEHDGQLVRMDPITPPEGYVLDSELNARN